MLICVILLGVMMLPADVKGEIPAGSRDPFAPVVLKNPDTTLFPTATEPGNEAAVVVAQDIPLQVRLTGVIWDAEKPFAIMSVSGRKRVFSVDDQFEGLVVDRIERNQVRMRYKNEKIVLAVGKEITL